MKSKVIFIMVKCSHCEGTGTINLTGAYADTLEILRKQKSPVTATSLARQCGVQPTAMANRLAWLKQNGLADCEQYGREKRYVAEVQSGAI